MGSVRSDHVGQRRAESLAAATSRARSASASASTSPAARTCSSRPASRPARRRRARPPSGLPRAPGRGAGEGGDSRGGTRGPGGPEPPARPPLHCGARGGGGSPAVPPAAGRGRGATLRGRSPVTGGRHLSGRRGPRPSPLGLRSVDRGKAPRVGRGWGVAVSVYIFHTANATKMAAACFLRNPLVFLSGCQNLLAVSCSPFPFPL